MKEEEEEEEEEIEEEERRLSRWKRRGRSCRKDCGRGVEGGDGGGGEVDFRSWRLIGRYFEKRKWV